MWRSAPSRGARRGLVSAQTRALPARGHNLVGGRFTILMCAVSMLGAVACTPKFEKLEDERSARGTIGEEVYKSLCRSRRKRS